VSRELKKIEKLFRKLKQKPAFVFPLPGKRPTVTTKQGVYVILSPQNKPVHVGRTLRGKRGIAQRLNNHLHGQSSFTAEYLDGNGSKLRGKYRFRYIEVPKARTRALLEAYAVARLCPKHLGLGEDAS
jgi:hypothetical protein